MDDEGTAVSDVSRPTVKRMVVGAAEARSVISAVAEGVVRITDEDDEESSKVAVP